MSTARVLKMREGLTKCREIVMKAYGQKKNLKMNDLISQCGMYAIMGKLLVDEGVIKDYHIEGETGHGLGRRLEWIYKGNMDGVVDGELVTKMINLQIEYDRNRRANKDLEEKAQKQITKLPNKVHEKGKATVDSVLLWVNEQIEKENTMQGYLRPIEKVMYGEIQQVLNNVKMSIEPLKKAIEKFNI